MSGDAAVLASRAREANAAGEHMLAAGLCERGLAEGDGEAGLLLSQQLALALARSGDAGGALGILEGLRGAGAGDPETLGLLGRVHKDLAAAAGDGDGRRAMLERARDFYREGFQRHGDTYCGVNAAAVSALLGDHGARTSLAGRVVRALGDGGDDYWSLATLAEARLLVGDVEAAARLYGRAVAVGGARRADVASTRKQCRLLCEAMFGDADRLREAFGDARVAVFSGHRPDTAGRGRPRFPREAEGAVAEAMAGWLERRGVCGVFASAAAGSDVIFLEKALAAGLDCHVVLPFPAEDFERASVADIGGDWVGRFRNVLRMASSVTVVDDGLPENAGGALAFCNLVMTARATACARAWGLPLEALVVWDRLPAEGAGGTAECVGMFRDAGLEVDVIDPLRARDGVVAAGGARGAGRLFANMPAVRAGEAGSEVSVMTGLLVNGYGQLGEAGLVALDRDVLGRLADMLAGEPGCLSCQGHCGEYVFFWDSPGAAGRAAPRMLRLLGDEARAMGLEVGFSMLLHVAPMQLVVNPLVHQYSREGRAAVALLKGLSRLAPGVVHATGRFADLLAMEAESGLECTYAGTLDAAGGPLGHRIHRLEAAQGGASG